MVARRSGGELHKRSQICTSMNIFPNPICIDGDLTTDSHRHHQPLLPPPQNPFHDHHLQQIQSSSADISCHNSPPRPSADLTADYPSIPDDEAGELEWLSRFVDNCSREDFVGETMVGDSSVQRSDTSFTSKAHRRIGKRSRAASRRWGLIAELHDGSYVFSGKGSDVRRCSHCASDETPQWRRGPLGPKTLCNCNCNVCGVRYELGLLVPEYRPASSSTFMLSQHSNSHRKVLELRRQEELASPLDIELQKLQLK